MPFLKNVVAMRWSSGPKYQDHTSLPSYALAYTPVPWTKSDICSFPSIRAIRSFNKQKPQVPHDPPRSKTSLHFLQPFDARGGAVEMQVDGAAPDRLGGLVGV